MAASHSHFESDEGQTSQQRQPIELRKGKEGRGECCLEVDRIIIVKRNLEVGRLRNSSSVSIFRVPNILIPDMVKREAYVPKRVPLGPYHHSDEKLPPMEEYKARAVGRMTTRFKHVRNLVSDPDCIMQFFDGATKEIVKLHKEIRDSYEEKINCGDEALAFMLTLDGCFILEILRTLSGDSLPGSSHFYEPLFEGDKILYTGRDILEDILKLENQVPWMVLVKLLKLELNSTNIDDVKIKLFEMLCPRSPQRRSFLSLLYPFNYEKDYKNLCSWPPNEEVHHLLGFMHRFFVSHRSDNGDQHAGKNARGDIANSRNAGYTRLPAQDNARGVMAYSHNGYTSTAVACDNIHRAMSLANARNAGYTRLHAQDNARGVKAYSHNGYTSTAVACDNIHRAMSLANAGIKFQPHDGGIASIHFDEKIATLFLPPITIEDSTETLFRNLIAFEMCKPSKFNYISLYVCLMDQLIDSEGDAALLGKMGIITNNLGSYREVAQLFNGLCKGVTVNLEDAFDNLAEKVNKQYNNKFRVQLTELVKEYFSSPWKTLGMLGGIALMLLTTLQTIFAILAVYK